MAARPGFWAPGGNCCWRGGFWVPGGLHGAALGPICFCRVGGDHERPWAPFTAMRGQVTRLHGAYGPLRAPSAGWRLMSQIGHISCCCAGYRWRTMVLATAAVPGCLCSTQVSFLACMRQASASNSSDSVLFPLL